MRQKSEAARYSTSDTGACIELEREKEGETHAAPHGKACQSCHPGDPQYSSRRWTGPLPRQYTLPRNTIRHWTHSRPPGARRTRVTSRPDVTPQQSNHIRGYLAQVSSPRAPQSGCVDFFFALFFRHAAFCNCRTFGQTKLIKLGIPASATSLAIKSNLGPSLETAISTTLHPLVNSKS